MGHAWFGIVTVGGHERSPMSYVIVWGLSCQTKQSELLFETVSGRQVPYNQPDHNKKGLALSISSHQHPWLVRIALVVYARCIGFDSWAGQNKIMRLVFTGTTQPCLNTLNAQAVLFQRFVRYRSTRLNGTYIDDDAGWTKHTWHFLVLLMNDGMC